MHPEHPVRLVVRDDLERTRARVFFTLLLAIPHFVWIFLWTIVMVFAVVANWIYALATGRPHPALHRLTCAYIRYATHLNAYVYLVANPYPGFNGDSGTYPIDLELPAEPSAQSRWKTFFRLFVALPAILMATALGGGAPTSYPSRGGGGRASGFGARGALAVTCAVLGWFACLVQGRMPKGLRDATGYSIGYSAQVLAFLLLVTDRYPDADPTAMLAGVGRPPEHPVRLEGYADDLAFSRVTVAFRIILVLPHVVWLVVWGIATVLAVIANWFIMLVSGRPADNVHAFVSRYIRYQLHVYSYLYLVANPYPPFDGRPGRYPIDVQLPDPAPQNRWKTGFRIILAIPAILVAGALDYGLFAAAFLTWFFALATGRAPWGLRNYSAYALRYQAQQYAYLGLLTDVYPHASPLEGAASPQHDFAAAA